MEATSAPRPQAVRLRKPRRLLAALSDERLVEHVRKGDAAAFEVLYDRHSGGLLGFCRHMLGSATDAEDALQQTFIAAHSDIQRHGERELYVKAWLYTIARNRCLSMLRARREHPTDSELELVTENLSDDVQQREDLRALLADVARLPEDQREALVLAEVGDLSHTDISQIIGCEPNKVKSLVFQARTSLIDRRIARETPCAEIREQIANLRGGALRRSNIKHHIEACPGCAQYREDVRRQRAMLAVALPVVPSAALRANVLGSLGIGGGSAASIGGGSGIAVATQSGLAKLGIAAALVAGGGTAAVATTHGVPFLHHSHNAASTAGSSAQAHASSAAAGHAAAGSAVVGGTGSGAGGNGAGAAGGSPHHPGTRSASGTAHGFTPTKGASNGAAARQFAATRGKGKHTGITNHPVSHSHRHTHAAPHGHVKHVQHVQHVRHVTTVHAAPAPKASPKAHATPKTVPTAPKTQSAPKTQTTPPPATQTQPAPQPTTTTPAPTGGSGGGKGGGGGQKRVTSTS